MLPSVVHHPRLTVGSYDTAPAGGWPGTATRIKTVVPRLGMWGEGFNAGDLGWVPRLGRSPGEGNGYPLQYCGLENSMDCRVIHGVAKS